MDKKLNQQYNCIPCGQSRATYNKVTQYIFCWCSRMLSLSAHTSSENYFQLLQKKKMKKLDMLQATSKKVCTYLVTMSTRIWVTSSKYCLPETMDFAYHFYFLVEKEIAKKIDALSADAASMKVTWNALLISLLSYIISYYSSCFHLLQENWRTRTMRRSKIMLNISMALFPSNN